jgi:predicted enzyme related to lactoylglutathione lyase
MRLQERRTNTPTPSPDRGSRRGTARLQAAALGAALILAGACAALAASAPPVLPPLTTASSNPRLPGKFVWADLVTDDVPAAAKFYGRLFGWSFQDAGNYLVALNEDRPVCGMFQRTRPADHPEARPRWFGYISVSNVEKAQRVVMEKGGRALAPPQKMPKRGEQAVFADPEGAVFGVVKSSSGDPEDFLASPGDWIWIQLLSHDARKAADFYRGIAGYEVIANNSTNRVNDFVLTSKGYARATVRTIAGANKKVQPTWLPYVRVKSVGESVALARQLGGKVLIEPKPELLEGKVAVVADPTGAAVGLLEWSEQLLKGGR